MTETYNRYAHRHLHHAGWFHHTWEITDGIGGRVLHSGWSLTRSRAENASNAALLDCEPSLVLRVERAADRLTREGLPVRAVIDELDRVCVTPLCACTTRDEVRVLREFLAIAASVRWEVKR